MKHAKLIQPITATLFVLWTLVSICLQAQDGYIHGDLKPGSYHVGFKVFHEYDASRMFKPEISEEGTLSSKPAPRPMQIAVWYPAQKSDNARYMALRDFYYLDATVEDPTVQVTDEMKHQLDQRFTNQTIFTGPADAQKIGSFLDLDTRALAEAHAVEGSFPLIIYSPREYRGVYYNTVLIEHLVSHGFIVAATPNKDFMSASIQGALSTDVLMAHIDDLRFVKGFMSDFPHVDMSQIGVVGWAWGAMPAIALAESDPNISAVVSLDGNIRFPQAQSVLPDVPGFSTADFSTPILHLETGSGGLNGADYTFYDELNFADAYHVTFRDAQWFTPSTFFYLVHGKGTANPDQFDFEAIDKAHDGMVTYAQRFLSAYLQKDGHAKHWLEGSVADQGFTEETVRKKAKAGGLLPPTSTIFANLFATRGPEAALNVWDRVKHEQPDYQIANAGDLNGLGYMLMWQGRMDDAVEAFKLQVREFPHLPNAWDSMGEGYKNNGDDQLAIEAFQKSLSLNPPEFVKSNSVRLLSELGVEYHAPDPYPLSSKEAKKLEGTYTYSLNGQEVSTLIKWDNGKLMALTDGQPDIELLPQSKDTFWAMQNNQAVGMTLLFNLEGRGSAQEISVTTPQGQQVTATRG